MISNFGSDLGTFAQSHFRLNSASLIAARCYNVATIGSNITREHFDEELFNSMLTK